MTLSIHSLKTMLLEEDCVNLQPIRGDRETRGTQAESTAPVPAKINTYRLWLPQLYDPVLRGFQNPANLQDIQKYRRCA